MKAIVATSPNSGIGFDNSLLYRDAKDMKIFKDTTLLGENPYVIMGKNTYESIGRQLPGRRNVIITKDTSIDVEGPGIYTIDYTDDKYYRWLFMFIKEEGAMCNIIGGAKVYYDFLPFISRIVDNRFKENPMVPADKYFVYPEGCTISISKDCGNFVSRTIFNEPLFLKNMIVHLNSANYVQTSRACEDNTIPLPDGLNYEMAGSTDMIRPLVRQLIHFYNENSPELVLFKKQMNLISWVHSYYELCICCNHEDMDKLYSKLYVLKSLVTLFESSKCSFNDQRLLDADMSTILDKQLIDDDRYIHKNKLHVLSLADEILYQIIDYILIEIYGLQHIQEINYENLLDDNFGRIVNILSDTIRNKLLEAFESYVTDNH